MELHTGMNAHGVSPVEYEQPTFRELEESLEQTRETHTQDQWAAAIESGGSQQNQGAGAAFGEPRYQVMERLVAAGVPHANYVSLSLAEFVQDPEAALRQVPADTYHLFVEPTPAECGSRLRFKDRSRENIMSIAAAFKEQPPESLSRVTILEAPELLYHGNVLVYSAEQTHGASGLAPRVHAEFTAGKNPPISRGITVPEFCFRQDPYTETFRYDFDDTTVRQQLYDSLITLPRQEGRVEYDGFRPQYVPGYYEIGIARKSDGAGLRAYVYDMKPWK